MIRTMLIYGLISGFIVIGVMSVGIAMSEEPGAGSGSQAIGYLIMLVALSLIFIGVKRYRDNERGGVIAFMPAFGLGLGVAAVAGVAYVIGWETYLATTGHDYMGDYIAMAIEKKAAAGATEAELAALTEKMNTLAANYKNPIFRMAITFTEIFPVGALIALISAALLRNPKVLPARQ